MPSVLAYVEFAVGTLVGLVIALLAVVFVRRRTIARGKILTVCGVRRSGAARWRLGLVRFGTERLEWYSLGGLSLRPKFHWERTGLDLEAPSPLVGEQRIDELPEGMRVPCRYAGESFELALQMPAYMALRSWLEAAPPGYNVHVA